MVDIKRNSLIFEREYSNFWKLITEQINKMLFLGTSQLITLLAKENTEVQLP